jgi:sugar O-acyltransferase (sialic acid O-acetyltransferase NeuD family)
MVGNPKSRLVLVGDGETALLAHDYFRRDTAFEVAGFSVEAAYLTTSTLLGLPVAPFETLETRFSPQTHCAFIAVSYTQLNRLRRRLFDAAKTKGYQLCSYISPHANIAPDVEVGENCFILEGVIVQRGVKIGDNVTLWSGSLIGHRSSIGDNCFVASEVAVSGFCTVGENCFLGVNSCIADCVKVGRDCVVGAGAVVVSDAAEGQVYVGNPAKPMPNRGVEGFISGRETI